MMKRIGYRENPEYYKRLIRKINDEIDFAGFLVHRGYRLLKKCSGSMEFVNEKDRIVLMTSRRPVSYFNRNDSGDQGLFFKYLRNRGPNFYESVKEGLEVIGSDYELDIENKKAIKNPGAKRTLENNYNIVPLCKPIYLIKERGIDVSTIHSPFFHGRILNAFHINDHGGKIANIAFPKYDLQGRPQNYVLNNRPYKDRSTGKLKKFKLVLNKKDHYLFYSNIPANGPRRIILGESAVELLSFNELMGTEGDFYISFGGNLYGKKLDFFFELISRHISRDNVELVFIFDNDLAGHQYDVQIMGKLINELTPGISLESDFRHGAVTMRMHYREDIRDRIEKDNKFITGRLKSGLLKSGSIRTVAFSDKLMLEFSVPKLMESKHPGTDGTNACQALLQILNERYLPIRTRILKSTGKDWNDDLIASKKKAFI